MRQEEKFHIVCPPTTKKGMRKNERIEPGIKNGNEHTMVIIFSTAAAVQ
jgi:hypothetical protein